ncbi:MAG: glutamate 5-kinase [Actinomycetaceae bacterium]|nr:glutamate 5-kinase [Actinomycetaceae bacterium]MDU0970087.1 glutamate 5-kinase [Actinomycetaceae bacterium]
MGTDPLDTRPRDPAGLPRARRVVIKIGSSSLTRADGGLDLNRLDQVAAQVAAMTKRGQEVIIVSSGAIAAGLAPLGWTQRPREVAKAQAAAALGQGLLLAQWRTAFQSHYRHVAQVLLTVSDVTRRKSYLNVRQALGELLAAGVIPVVNENDTVATDEINFGDNDRLAAMVAQAISADVLVLLTDVDGLYTAPPGTHGARRIGRVDDIAELAGISMGGRGSHVGTGGMVTKIQAARIAVACGIPVQLAAAEDFADVVAGADCGTWFAAASERRPQRLAWVAHAASVAGRVTIDAGALAALVRHGSSLLAAGVTGVAGDFMAGDVVGLWCRGDEVGRGVVAFDSEDARRIAGMRMADMDGVVPAARPLVHRDDLVLFASAKRLA